jgi:hypothetical protein
MTTGEHEKVNRPKQDGYKIFFNPGNYKFDQILVRVGTKDGNGNYKWDNRTMAWEPVEINQGLTETVAMVDADQLPCAAKEPCFYQLLCEIKDTEHESEWLMTEPTLLV